MWQALRDILGSVKESVGIEGPAVPDPAVVADPAAEAATSATEVATDAAGSVAEALGGAGQEITAKVSDFLGGLGG
ncbi:hypothetical protein ODJ79_37610 [Actinoplanes sp. KI2]|uniref:hypothetical protein n=1 Tax=Actinoplanes sp. KI2 TaxID=2983315 RepID=UPI0021D587B3|nr:hypothetical protein [Actinoplanes sp. KI2]MCU7729467.1 hypothetical protein [Actinoplanes sp. KI2]